MSSSRITPHPECPAGPTSGLRPTIQRMVFSFARLTAGLILSALCADAGKPPTSDLMAAPTNWIACKGEWMEREQGILVKATGPGGDSERKGCGAILVTRDSTIGDAEVTITKIHSDGDVYNLLARARDEANAVQFGRSGNRLVLAKVRDGHFTLLQQVDSQRQEHEKLSLRIVGNSLRAAHNGTLVFVHIFEKGEIPATGRIGLQANHLNASFASLTLNTVTERAPAVNGLLRQVNILQGTDSEMKFSRGNTLPLVGTPFGMTDWCPQTTGDHNARWFYMPKVEKFLGYRATHQPSPWMGDYGNLLFMPQTGPLIVGAEHRASDYDWKSSLHRPDYIRIALPRYGLLTELTASERCAVMRLTHEGAREGRLIIDPAGESFVEVSGRRFQGYTRFRSNAAASNYATYFVGELDREIIRHGTFGGGANRESERPTSRPRIGGYVEFDVAVNPVVEVRIATSHISLEQAAFNLETETRGGFEAVRLRTEALWEESLKRIEIEADPETTKTFYTCLYRALKFPHRFHERAPDGKTRHWSPFDGKVHEGVLYVDSGLWDTFRTQFPFLSVVYPESYGEIVEGWCNAYRAGGWLPQWPSPGGFGGMVGTHADAMLADAIVKRIPGFDPEVAYAAIRRDAFEIRKNSSEGGRSGMKHYLELGYVPARSCGDWVSASLDFAYDDWCVAQAAKQLGKQQDYHELMRRAQNYRKNWDPAVGFMRGRNADGSWDGAFDAFAWGNGYCEGGPWQCSWAVQHDVAGLVELLGGREGFIKKWDTLFNQPPTFHVGGYTSVIHEMTEMAAVQFGQWAQGNQPSFHLPYLYAAVGQPWKTEYWTRKACAELYGSEASKGYPGDEDNGSSACWYLLSAMGFYPLTPGHPSYVLTSPLLQKATLHLPGGKTFQISAPDNSARNVYVKNRLLNQKPFTRLWLSHEAIVQGGTLEVSLGEKPMEREYVREDLPYSASINEAQATSFGGS